MSTDKPGPFMREMREMIKLGYRPTIINRDLNASLNIRLKGWHILSNIKEPKYLDSQLCIQEVANKKKLKNTTLIKRN